MKYINDGFTVAVELNSLLKHLKPSLVEKLCWEQNLDFLTDEELKQISNAVDKKMQEDKKACYGINPDTFYTDA